MSHPDPMTLALAALGEEIDAADVAHLASCEQCRDEVAELAEVVAIGREAPSELPELPDQIWTGIQQDLGFTIGPPAALPLTRRDGVVPGDASGSGASGSGPSAPPPAQEAGDGTVVPLVRRSGWGRLAAVASVAAMAGALVGGTVVWSALNRATPDPGDVQLVVARATLDPLSESVSEPGEAKVLDSPDGQVVRVDARSLPQKDGFYEVWLLDADATKLVALGALPAGAVGTFTVPPGVSIEDFPVVDISLESYDGDPGHSKNSLMRGVLV